jgi:hypothetical protein
METKMFKHVNADNETYKLFRQFFIDCGHHVEEKMPAANTRFAQALLTSKQLQNR